MKNVCEVVSSDYLQLKQGKKRKDAGKGFDEILNSIQEVKVDIVKDDEQDLLEDGNLIDPKFQLQMMQLNGNNISVVDKNAVDTQVDKADSEALMAQHDVDDKLLVEQIFEKASSTMESDTVEAKTGKDISIDVLNKNEDNVKEVLFQAKTITGETIIEETENNVEGKDIKKWAEQPNTNNSYITPGKEFEIDSCVIVERNKLYVDKNTIDLEKNLIIDEVQGEETDVSEKVLNFKEEKGSKESLSSQKEDVQNIERIMQQINVSNIKVKDKGFIDEPKLQIQNVTKDLPEMVLSKLKTIGDNDNKDLIIQLEPKELGKMILKLTTNDGNVSVKIIAHVPMTRDLLESSLNNLKQSFIENGIKYDQMDVELGGQQFSQNNYRGQNQQQWQQSEYGKNTDYGELEGYFDVEEANSHLKENHLRTGTYDYII